MYPSGRLAEQTDASGTMTVIRDPLGRVTTQTPPAGSAITYGYDAAGHTLVNSNGVTTSTTTYDPLWRVSTEKVQDATTGATEQTTSYTYDANGNPLNPITTYANGTQSGVTHTYDKLGRIASMSDGTRNYTYDGNGNLSSMQVLGTSGTPVVEEDFSYDGANRPAGLTDKVGTSGATLHTYSYAYTQAGNAGSITTDGVTTSYTFDTANELTQTSVGSGSSATTNRMATVPSGSMAPSPLPGRFIHVPRASCCHIVRLARHRKHTLAQCRAYARVLIAGSAAVVIAVPLAS